MFKLIKNYFNREIANVVKKGIKLSIFGELKKLPKEVKIILKKSLLLTKNNKKIVVNLAINYGSKYEIASVEYNGGAPSTLNQTYPVAIGYNPGFFLNHSGYQTTVHVCGGGSGGGAYSGLFEIEILFSRGQGSTGSYILYDLEELI